MTDKKVIAVFDFDDTITIEKTLYDFILFYGHKTNIFAKYILIPILRLLEFLNLIGKEKIDGFAISYFLKGESKAKIDETAKKYATQLIEILNPHALDKIQWHQDNGHTVVIDCSACEDWVLSWAKTVGIEYVIATQLEVNDGVLTGNIKGRSCTGKAKISRLLELFPDRESYTLYVYGDNRGDKELLAMADYPFFRKF